MSNNSNTTTATCSNLHCRIHMIVPMSFSLPIRTLTPVKTLEQWLLQKLLNQSLKSEMANNLFKQERDLEKRRAEAARIREKYPDSIPVIVEKGERSDVPNIDKKRYVKNNFDFFLLPLCIWWRQQDQSQFVGGEVHIRGDCGVSWEYCGCKEGTGGSDAGSEETTGDPSLPSMMVAGSSHHSLTQAH